MPSSGQPSSGQHVYPQSLTKNLWERLELIARTDENYFPIRLSVDETEEVIRILWEFVGHMGRMEAKDAGGYEERLLQRARHHAQELQTAMLAAVAYAGPILIETVKKVGAETAQEDARDDAAG